MKERCCPNTPSRKIIRSIHEAARDVARRIAETPEYVRSLHNRKKIEVLFAQPRKEQHFKKSPLAGNRLDCDIEFFNRIVGSTDVRRAKS